jgi:hypothetical protein
MRLRFVFALGIAVILVLACCNKPEAPKPAQPGPSWPGKITLVVRPDPPLNNKPVQLQVKLTDASGKPISGAQVKASLVMPLMDMGKNEISFTDKGDGNYEGTGKFTMVGPWNVIVTASAGGKTGEQRFDLAVRE